MHNFDAYAIFGPPGTGKTTEMLRLVGDAKTRGYGPFDIGFYAFTKAAANEALKRLGITRSDKISTLHSLAFRSMGAAPQQMVDGYKLRKFGKAAKIAFTGGKSDEYGEELGVGDRYLAIYDRARSTFTENEAAYYESDRPGDFAEYEMCIQSYENWKNAYGFTDFTDLIINYVNSDHPRNHGARILFIDEAQDLSPLQWRMIDRMLSFDQVREVTIAGDDDQAIFEWAGADPHGMAKFCQKYEAKQEILAQSYRVPKAMHEVARDIVVRIKNRVQKKYKPASHEGAVVRFGNDFDPSTVKHGDDVLILCRASAQKKVIEEALIAARVPYSNEGGRPGLFDSIWAQAIRAHRKLKMGHEISEAEAEALLKAGTQRTQSEVAHKNFAALARQSYEECLAIPIQLIEFFRQADITETPTIRISTIHNAKGREARHVVLYTPLPFRSQTAMELSQSGADAEARVWYVGVTRAKERLDIVSSAEVGYEV